MRMKNNIELLAPGGDVESVKAAIAAGADAVYCGLQRFNARNRAGNLSYEELDDVLQLAHGNDCLIYLTLNILIVETELPALVDLLNKVGRMGVDGIIVQDLGLFYLLRNHFNTIPIHASTQLTTHNSSQLRFLDILHAKRVNLCRELNYNEIRLLSAEAEKLGIVTEMFVHGAHCLSFSGICYMSSVMNRTSGNRGRCSQPCRSCFEATEEGKSFPLNLKDMSLFTDIAELIDSGAGSLKIEGRIKKFHYVYTVVKAWREQLQKLKEMKQISCDDDILRSVFNRDFTGGYFKGKIGPEMFIDDNRDNSALSLINASTVVTEERLKKAKKVRYDQRTVIINSVKDQIVDLEKKKASGERPRIKTSTHCMEILKISKPKRKKVQPALTVLLSSKEDLYLTQDDDLNDIDFYYKLPDNHVGSYHEINDIFYNTERLRPWFPAIQMENSLKSSVELLRGIRPDLIITDNSGIAYEAQKLGIGWIAGPQFNITNSYSLKCLKELFNCVGAFISNELKKTQINLIAIPDDFELHYSIFHPLLLMTTRQCLFHQVTGCNKEHIDESCTAGCERMSRITTINGQSIIIEKTKNQFQKVFADSHMLNLEVVKGIDDMFTRFCIDLSNVQTETNISVEKYTLVKMFQRFLQGREGAEKSLLESINVHNNIQYENGL